MSTTTPIKQGSPLRDPKREATPGAPPQPVIPTTWLAPDEQRRLVLWTFGLVEVCHRRLLELIAGDEGVGLGRAALHRAPNSV